MSDDSADTAVEGGDVPLSATAQQFKDRVREVFSQFDDDGSGEIDSGELKEIMMTFGQHCTEAELLASSFPATPHNCTR